MSALNIGMNDVSEETQAFKDKLASKGPFLRYLPGRVCGMNSLQMVISLHKKRGS